MVKFLTTICFLSVSIYYTETASSKFATIPPCATATPINVPQVPVWTVTPTPTATPTLIVLRLTPAPTSTAIATPTASETPTPLRLFFPLLGKTMQ